MASTIGTIRSCSKSQRVFPGGFTVAVVVPWLVLVVVIWLYPPLKPVQSQPNIHTAISNAIIAISTTIITRVRNPCCCICFHNGLSLDTLADPSLPDDCIYLYT